MEVITKEPTIRQTEIITIHNGEEMEAEFFDNDHLGAENRTVDFLAKNASAWITLANRLNLWAFIVKMV